MSQQRFRLLGDSSTSGESPGISHCHLLMGGIKKHSHWLSVLVNTGSFNC